MIDTNKFIQDNAILIERFVDLSLCRDSIYDSQHRWFYSLISLEELQSIQHIFSEEDIRADIYLHIIEQAQNYSKSTKLFKQYLKKDLGWFLKYKLNSYKRQIKHTSFGIKPFDEINEFALDDITLNNIFTKYKNKYSKYLLYLLEYKCYTINQISSTVYQDRSTLREYLKTRNRIGN